MAAAAGPSVGRQLSAIYGCGASKYDEATLSEWKSRGEAAGEAARQQQWSVAREGYERCMELRPDHDKVRRYLELSRSREAKQRSLERSSEESEAASPTLQPQGVACATADHAASPVPIPPPPAAPSAAASSAAASAASAACASTLAAGGPTAGAASASRRPGKASVAARRSRPSLVVLIGLPGAGKSTLTAALAASGGWTVISQDALGGSKHATEEALVAAIRAGESVVVDRCNVRRADRLRLLDVAMAPRDAVAVHVATAADACVERVASRTDHPSIPYGHGRPAVLSMAKALEPPTLADGFAAVHTLSTPAEVDTLLRAWGAGVAEPAPAGLYKFPRTHHVLNTGGTAVSRDDLVMSAADAAPFFDGRTVVVAEEKVDGANLGFSLTKDYTILAQNRSHFVNSESHGQFKALDGWLTEHGWALCQLLEPEVEVLFGEWVALKHSVAYTKLPGYFVAFDLFDKRTGTFASATERDRRLRGLGIPIVRQLAHRPFASQAELLALLEETSAYADGFVEGAYLRIDAPAANGTTNTRRGKIVRSDFIQGCADGHWLGKEPVRNVIRTDLWMEEHWA